MTPLLLEKVLVSRSVWQQVRLPRVPANVAGVGACHQCQLFFFGYCLEILQNTWYLILFSVLIIFLAVLCDLSSFYKLWFVLGRLGGSVS